jgi:hypothetical protein
VTFSHIGESHGFIPPGTANQTDNATVKIASAGTYMYDFSVRGTAFLAGVPSNHPLAFQLTANGVAVPGSQYVADENDPTETNFNHVVHGFGIFTASQNTNINLNNITGSFLDDVHVLSIPTGPPGSLLAVNASLRLVKICF